MRIRARIDFSIAATCPHGVVTLRDKTKLSVGEDKEIIVHWICLCDMCKKTNTQGTKYDSYLIDPQLKELSKI